MTPPYDYRPHMTAIETCLQRRDQEGLLTLASAFYVMFEQASRALNQLVSARLEIVPTDDHALSAGKASVVSGYTRGGKNGYSPRWFYDHATELPFTVRSPGQRTVRFSENGLREWLRRR